MFAMEIDVDPLSWYKLPGAVHEWLEAVGGFAILGLIIWLIFWLVNPPPTSVRKVGLSTAAWLLWSTVVAGWIGLLPILFFVLWDSLGLHDPLEVRTAKTSWTRHLNLPFVSTVTPASAAPRKDFLYFMYYLASCLAIAAVLVPFLVGVSRLRFRRIWSLAKLSFKGAIRRRGLWAFSSLLLCFLFSTWYLPHKHGDQVSR